MVTTRDFRLFQTLVHREAGIALSDHKRALLAGRLAPRLRALGMESFQAYYDRVCRDDAERVRMIDAICTNETHFFREPKQFELLEREVIPAWRSEEERGLRPKQLRVWSAACSTGEEPYSIAMALVADLPGWTIDITASDISTKVLDRARLGTWPIARATEIPRRYRNLFMLQGRGPQEGMMAVRTELASLVRFMRINLQHERYPVSGRFDLIFCRNVLIYFDADAKRRIVDRLIDRLTPHGLLFLGHAESIHGHERVRSAGPTVYTLREPK